MDSMDDQASEQSESVHEAPTGKECGLCERLAALVGCLIGGFIVLVGFDLITKGAVSRRVNRNDVVLRDIETEIEDEETE
jgi:hypothetical protein